jgi:hypothetical protein
MIDMGVHLYHYEAKVSRKKLMHIKRTKILHENRYSAKFLGLNEKCYQKYHMNGRPFLISSPIIRRHSLWDCGLRELIYLTMLITSLYTFLTSGFLPPFFFPFGVMYEATKNCANKMKRERMYTRYAKTTRRLVRLHPVARRCVAWLIMQIN